MHKSFNHSRDILEEYKRKVEPPKDDLPGDVRKALDYILARLFDNALTISALKQECKIYNGSFSGEFGLYIRLSPKEFILEHRISAGKELLVNTGLTVSQVGLAVGFSSHSAFYKAFKNKAKWVNPMVWREENSGNNSGETSG